ncbi:MAG: redoxin domain-containing protein [Pseudarcicella sp.]|nr:redoxin domain-containing protein [Pseudarcicella sp.]MBP6411047.1 redoxin domain-containing protein [Pseudarcicella sp.]
MKIKALFTSFFIFSVLLGYSQKPSADKKEPYSIKIKVKGINSGEAYLAHYFGYNQQVIKDTAKIASDGSFLFEGNEKLPKGLYLITVSKNKYFDLVIGETQMSIETDTLNFAENTKITGSKENKIFYEYQKAMSQYFTTMRKMRDEYKDSKDVKIEERLKKVQNEVDQFQEKWEKENEGTLVVKFIKSSKDPIVPEYKLPMLNKQDTLNMRKYQYEYYKSHYLDNVDFKEEILVRTPFLQRKLEKYFEDLVIQQNDSLSKEADIVLSKIPKEKSLEGIRKYVIYKITNQYETPKVVGTDGVFIHMAEKYYINEPNLWDTSTVTRMKERVQILKPLMVGKVVPEMYLTDTSGNEMQLTKIKGKYIVMFIYDPECGHCKESAPKLVKMLPKLKEMGATVFAPSIERDKKKWMKFISEFKTQSFINGIDVHINPNTKAEEYYTDFKKTYDVYSTPVTYILDKDKKIIAKRLPVENVEDFLNFYERNEKAKLANTKK